MNSTRLITARLAATLRAPLTREIEAARYQEAA